MGLVLVLFSVLCSVALVILLWPYGIVLALVGGSVGGSILTAVLAYALARRKERRNLVAARERGYGQRAAPPAHGADMHP